MTEIPALEVRGVRKRFDKHQAVDGVEFSVPVGSVFGLLGPNGAGKTTTIRMIMDILAPDEGEIRLSGRRRHLGDGARIGYLPEERGLYRKMTVEEHLVYLGELQGLSRSQARREASAWLERIGLGDRAKAKVETLSKGMQQKIQLAGTVMHDPELLILDEPFSGLDPINQTLFKELIAEFRGRGRTILFSTHVMEHAEKLCERIALIAKGKVVLAGELAAIKRERGGGVYRLKGAGPWDSLATIAGVRDVLGAEAGEARIVLAPETEPDRVLRALIEHARIAEFRSEEPDLETIFVQAVNDAH